MSDCEALRLADALETPTIQAGAFRHEAAAELRRLAGVEAERDALRALIADHEFAALFHSLSGYRAALLNETKGGGNEIAT